MTEQIQQLVNKAFAESPEKAVQDARATGNPALVDALHAALTEPTVHDELVKRHKVQPAA